MFTIVLKYSIPGFSSMSYFHVVPSHEGDGISGLVPGIHIGNSVLAVEGDGLFSFARYKLQVAQLVAVSFVVDIKAVVFNISNPHVWFFG